MAYGDTFHPAQTSRDIKIRGPLWVGVASTLSLFLFAFYVIYWYYVFAKDLSEYGKAKGHDLGQRPGMTLAAFLIGWVLLFIPPIVATYRMVKRTQQAQQLAGVHAGLNGWLALVLLLVFSPAFYAYEQSELNKAWAAEGGPVPNTDLKAAPPLPSGPAASSTSSAPEISSTSPERPGV